MTEEPTTGRSQHPGTAPPGAARPGARRAPSRRALVRSVAGAVSVLAAGCPGDPPGGETPRPPDLGLAASVERSDSVWRLDAIVYNESFPYASLHDVTVVAYSRRGALVCEAPVGDLLETGRKEAAVATTCSGYPAVVTATARESPCDGARIEVLYWTGTDAQRTGDVSDDVDLWGNAVRRCGEELPPPRFVGTPTGRTASPNTAVD